MAKLYFRYGAMGSSKTANAIMVQYNYHERGQKALMLKPRLETRDGEKTVRSRSGLSAPCEYVEDLDTIDVSAYDCLIVDEAQFLTKSQVERLVRVVDEQNVPVIAYGLRTDFRTHLFEGSKRLLEIADTIDEIKSTCTCGRKTIVNARVNSLGEIITEGEVVEIGGNERYIAVCRNCWRNKRIEQSRKSSLPLD